MDDVRYEDLEEFVPEKWTVREFMTWLDMWLDEDELDLPLFIDCNPISDYHVYVSEEYPLGDYANKDCEYIKAVCMSL